MSYAIGQRLVSTNSAPWGNESGRTSGPKKGDIVTCSGHCHCGCGYIYLKEYPGQRVFDPQYLRPVEDANLTASLAQTESERWVVERPEHVNEPQTA